MSLSFPKLKLSHSLKPSTATTSLAMKDHTHVESESLIQPPNLVFSKFSAELRVNIMRYVAPGPRRVKLKWDEEKEIFKTDAKPPVNLAISSEWRIEFLKKYILAFGTDSSPARIPVDFSKDQIYLPDVYPMERHPMDLFIPLIGTSDFAKIQKLRIDRDLMDLTRLTEYMAHPVYSSIETFAGLKNLTILVECEEHGLPHMTAAENLIMGEYNLILDLTLKYIRDTYIFELLNDPTFSISIPPEVAPTFGAYLTSTDSSDSVFDSTFFKSTTLPTFAVEMVSADGKKCPECLALKAQERFAQAAAERMARGEGPTLAGEDDGGDIGGENREGKSGVADDAEDESEDDEYEEQALQRTAERLKIKSILLAMKEIRSISERVR